MRSLQLLVAALAIGVSAASSASLFDDVQHFLSSGLSSLGSNTLHAIQSSLDAGPLHASVSPTGFIDTRKTLAGAKRLAKHSWEYGTVIEASLEVNNPELTVFSRNAFPNGRVPYAPTTTDALTYALGHLLFDNKTLADGEGAVGDPASLGVAAVLLSHCESNAASAQFAAAAQRQADTVLSAPKLFNGALSQRYDVAEAWADYMFMAPPFLAYYAVDRHDPALLRFVVDQCALQRQVLLANTTEPWHGLWAHILGPQTQTLGIWATGNGWAALGLVRVLATVMHWHVSASWHDEQAMLISYLMDIFNALPACKVDPTTGMLRNYLVGGADDQNDNSVEWYGDGAGTASLVAAALRLAVLKPALAPQLITIVDPLRRALARAIDSDGLVAPTVNPYDWHDKTPYTLGSPEAQAFASMAGAAWRDCVVAGICHDDGVAVKAGG